MGRQTKLKLETSLNIRTCINGLAISALLGVCYFSLNEKGQEDGEAVRVGVVRWVGKGWEQADGKPFWEHFLDFEGARYIESGGQNAGLTDLIEHHVEPEGDALDSLELNFSDVETHFEGDFAWAIANVEVKATVKRDQRVIHNRGYQTFLFRRVNGKWLIIHTHSSSRPVKSD